MNKNIIFCFLFVLSSCLSQEIPKECTVPLGKLMLSAVDIDWGNIQLGRSYTRSIKIFNATSNEVALKIRNSNTELQVMKVDNNQINLEEDTFFIPALHSDSIQIVLSPRDTASIGEFTRDVYIEFDGKLLLAPLKQYATVFENFDNILNEKKECPVIEIDKDTFDFGTITWSDRPIAKFSIKNRGKRNLIIRKVEKKCGCANVHTLDRVIQPEKTTTLNVTFNPIGKNGKQSTQVRIFCNDPNQPVTDFTITGYVSNESKI